MDPFQSFPHEDAIDDLKHALALDPNLDEARHYLGLVFVHVGLMRGGSGGVQRGDRIEP